MLELGTGIGLGALSISVGAVAITAIRQFGGKNGNGNSSFSQKLCDEKHRALEDKFDGFERWMSRVEDKLDKALDR